MSIIKPSRGSFRIGLMNKFGKMYQEEFGHNIVTYEGIDLLGKLLAGSDLKVNTMYMEFTNNPTVPSISPDPADGRSYYAALDSGGSDSDYLRIPLGSETSLSSTDDTKYETNKATFFGMSTGQTAGRGGKVFGTNSKVYGVALVAAPDPNDASKDIVFSRSYDFTAKTKQVDEEISIIWSHVFGDEMLSSS
jgi:hypothetical protein